jgi:transmembrane sensor
VKKYKDYSVEQLVSDEFFQQWVKTEHTETKKIWENWLQENPEKEEEVREARIIILSFNLSANDHNDIETEIQLEKLMLKINEQERHPLNKKD